MFEGALQPMHWLVVAAIALIFFGPKRLPELGKSLGQAIRGFKGSMREAETGAIATKEDGSVSQP
ncbi:MAG TPA: twin-arginine translocase TatA/TatE family subunit [Vicinamibacterales bacterium]|nr:twin-arginine translocase TatA/TatE family subunit [Vicinamibacterales bacterium]